MLNMDMLLADREFTAVGSHSGGVGNTGNGIKEKDKVKQYMYYISTYVQSFYYMI